MMISKKLLMLPAALFSIIAVSANAVASPQLPPNAGVQIARALNLTDSQKSQLKPLLSSIHQQFRSIRNDTTLTPLQRKQKIQALRLQMRTQIDLILTPEQQQQLKYLRQQEKSAWRNRQHTTPPLQ